MLACMFDLNAYMREKRHAIDRALDNHLPDSETRPRLLHEAMRYAVFAGGKRLRPILCLAAAEALENDTTRALIPAIAIEALHTYTLVHDDLPAMDDDAMRRGLPTTHIQYGEAHAILVGDALLTLAFEWMAQCRAPEPYLPNQYALELAEAAGSRGVIAGQIEDLEAEGEDANADRLDFIHLHKTAALIRCATRIGAIASGADAQQLEALSEYGCRIGLAFQIADDILDVTATTDELGKPAGSDEKNSKMTYVTLLGVDGARKKATQLIEQALHDIASIGTDTTRAPLVALAQEMIQRNH
jgi:geranylgeranyl diphosphate synthase, type II